MLHALEVFRVHVANHPLLLALLIAASLQGFSHLRRDLSDTLDREWRRVVAILGGSGLLAYIVIALWYSTDPHFFDPVEPTIIAIGWLFDVGKPVYHSVDSPERYSHIYGPMLYVVQGMALAVGRPSVIAAKAVGVVSGLGSLGLVFGTLRSSLPARSALAMTGLCALLLLMFRDYSFWSRAESLELLMVSASLVVAVRSGNVVAVVVVGLASGILWNLKITGPLYSLPVFVVIERRFGLSRMLIAAGLALAVVAAPFIIFRNVSLLNYVVWIQRSARAGLQWSTLRQNLEWGLFLGLPVILSQGFAHDRRSVDAIDRASGVALFAGMLGVVVAASKPGAGAYHLLPFVPIMAWWTARRLDRISSVPVATLAFATTGLMVSVSQQAQFIATVEDRRARHEIADIENFVRSHAGRTDMGYGETEPLTLERPVLVFRNGAYLLDEPAVREYQLQGVAFPNATIEAIRACRVDYWLIPRGEEPFAARNQYAAVLSRPMFPPEFREAFESSYDRISPTDYYDVWKCRAKPAI